jgi:NAD(P)-dependent dehydrogenase (short-subunit alcohol dehydrogenase family)
MRLADGRKVLVTGGAGALGQAIVPGLRDAGASVAVVDVLPPDQLPAIVSGAASHYLAGDAGTEAAADELVAAAARRLGNLTDVVLLAGRVHSAPLVEQSDRDVQAVFALNVHTALRTAQAATRWWLARELPGNLVFVSSWVQDVPWPGIAPYAASKAALRSLARSFAREYAARGIRANVLAPGIVDAGMARRQWETEPDYRARASRAIPLGHLQPPDSVAGGTVFLCSPMASYMTGATLLMDGGASLYPMDPEETSHEH